MMFSHSVCKMTSSSSLMFFDVVFSRSSEVEFMISQLDFVKVSTSLRDMLCHISDQAHDRCVKILTMRSKVSLIFSLSFPLMIRGVGKLWQWFYSAKFHLSLTWTLFALNFIWVAVTIYCLVFELQDGFLEKLTSAEFVILSRAIEQFVTSCEAICGKKSTSLRTSFQSQVFNVYSHWQHF